jgi:hypothetical protein
MKRTLPLLWCLSACFEAGRPPPPPARICARMVECGGWGWRDQNECEQGVFEDGDYDDGCVAEKSYRQCMDRCVDQACPQFTDCEADCWERSC